MTIGASIFLIAVGAIGLILGLFMMAQANKQPPQGPMPPQPPAPPQY